jgi:hypothetical protein
MTLRRSCIVALAAAFAAGAHAAAPAGAAPAHSAKACSAPDYPGNGYFTSLRVRNASCGKGRKVARAHYNCRRKNGVKGRCHHKVKRFRCKERRPASARIPTQYSARVTCKRGSRRVKFVYQQNT